MSAAAFQPGSADPGAETGAADLTDVSTGPDPRVAGTSVVVRRNAGVAALVGASASAIAIAYLWRATSSGAPLDWVLCLVMTAVAALYLAHLVDARTPLLIADELGVRIRLANQWRGLPWDAVGEVVVQQRRGLLKDGRLVFAPHGPVRSLDGLDARGRRAAVLNQRLYGAALAVPLGLSTRVSSRGAALVGDLTTLARDRAAIIEASRPAPADPVEASRPAPADPVEASRPAAPEPRVAPIEEDPPPVRERPARPGVLGGLATVVSGAARGRRRDLDARRPDHATDEPLPELPDEPADELPDETDDLVPAQPPVPLRAARRGLRAQLSRDLPTEPSGPAPAPEPSDAHRDLDPDGNVRPIAALGEPVEALVVDDFVVEPAYDPVIGPELAAARTRVGLSVDELAERTRIRPHVIESIEVDDFAPCGGDFYARGHLRTLARVLGRDPVSLLQQFDQRYATAPINARRVFEAELATGMTGSMRRTSGGPNWGLLVGVVLVLVMTWGVVRLFASEPAQQLQSPVPGLNAPSGAAAVDPGPADASAPATATAPVDLALVAAQDASQVVVRDGTGTVVWAGEVVPGEARTLRVTPPVRVRAEDAGAVEVAVDGEQQGQVGQPGEPGRRVFQRP